MIKRIIRYFLAIKFVRFAISGGIATLVDVCLLYLLTEFAGIWYLISSIFSFIVGSFVHFLISRNWVFKNNQQTFLKQYLSFSVVHLGGLIINTIVLYTLVEFFHVYYILAKLLTVFFGVAWTFWANKKFTFSEEKHFMSFIVKIKNQIKTVINSTPVWFFVIFGIALTVYMFTLCPTVYLEDSSEFVTVVETLGIPHPSGYPLYVLLGKFFSLIIPIGTIAWKINLMSAFFGALTISFLFLIIRKILILINKRQLEGNRLIYNLSAFSSSLILAFTLIFWSQAIVAEVYTLNTFFVALIVYFLLIWREKIEKQAFKTADKLLLFTIFIFGLSLTNHQMMLLLSPVFITYVIWIYPKVFKDYKLILSALFLVFLGLSVYLYLPIRAAQDPVFNWGNPQDIRGFKSQLLREQYNDLKLDSAKIFDKNKLPFVSLFFKDISIQFTIPACFIIFLGFLLHYLRDKKTYFLLLGIFVCNSLLIILIRSSVSSPINDFYFRVYYLPAYFVLIAWAGVCFQFLIKILFKFINNISKTIKTSIKILVILIIFLLPFSFLINNWNDSDRDDFWFVNDWARAVLESMDQDSYLMLNNDQPAFDSMIFSLFYIQAVENVRLDVKLVNLAGIRGMFYSPFGAELDDFFEWDDITRKDRLAKFMWDYVEDESIYLLHPLGKSEEIDLVTRSNGIVYKLYENIDEAKKDEDINLSLPGLRNLDYIPLEYNMFYLDFLSDYFLARSSFFMENGYKGLSHKHLLKSIEYDSSPFSFNYQAFIGHRDEWMK
ncbi:MAG: DUF2723 domain-containing protein [Patescibacteria group bacterium]